MGLGNEMMITGAQILYQQDDPPEPVFIAIRCIKPSIRRILVRVRYLVE